MATPTGSQFVAQYGKAGIAAWEAAAIQIAREGGLTPFPWTTLLINDDHGNNAQLKVQNDVIAIGPLTDYVRLPTLPGTGQSILNLAGWLYPTPWLSYQIYAHAIGKGANTNVQGVAIEPIAMVPNKGADMAQYAAHSAAIDKALAASGESPDSGTRLRAGLKKHIVVSNDTQQKGKVLIFGWYHPSPNVWPSNGLPMGDPKRQPIQPNSNAHGDFYVDYSHGVQAIGPDALVNGQPMKTIDLYQHPTLWTLVSKDGPIKVPRYPAVVAPQTNVATPGLAYFNPREVDVTVTVPGLATQGLNAIRRG